jgi:hypothetical protein
VQEQRNSTGARAADVRGDGIDVRRTHGDVGVKEARRRFGGLDVPATLVGMLTALATLVLLGGLIGAAIGAIGYQTGLDGAAEELSIAGLVGGLVTLFVAFLIGGWAAGRIARYDGGKNGLMTAIWAIVLAAVLAGLGAWLGSEYDVFRNVDLPQFFSRDAATVGGIVSALVAAATMLLAGFLGGKWGERFHRRADAAILETRSGGIGRTGEREVDGNVEHRVEERRVEVDR